MWFAVPGCCCCSDWCNRHGCDDIPAGAIPVCTGVHTHEIFRKQAEIAEADDFVIYECEWLYDPVRFCGSAKPGPYGTYHLAQMLKRLPEVPYPVLIQMNVDAKLNEARRQFVVQFLESNGLADAETRVILGFPEAEGLFGNEAAAIFRMGYGGPGLPGAGGPGGNGPGGYGGFGYGGMGGLGGIGGYGGMGGMGGLGGIGGLRPY